MISDHPEIDDDELVVDLLARQQDPTKGGAVDLLVANSEKLEWKNGLNDDDLKDALMHLVPSSNRETLFPELRIFFIINNFKKAGGIDISKTSITTLQTAGLSSIIVGAMCDPDEKWSKMGDTCFMCPEREHEGKKAPSFEICYRYTCGWGHGISYIEFHRSGNIRSYFCVNYPLRARQRLEKLLQERPQLAHRELFIDALAADESLKMWKTSLGQKRRLLINYEKNRRRAGTIESDTEQLHILSRDWHILHQDLSDFSAQLKFLRESLVKYRSCFDNGSTFSNFEDASNITESFDMLESRSDIYRRWISNYRDRTNIRINLLFHLANQAEARTNTQIAVATAKLAEQTQRDSSSMITIASVTMLFLPGTFISAILSTTFFAYDSTSGLQVSNQWWILPASTLPLTIVVFGVWLMWQRIRMKKTKKQQGAAASELPHQVLLEK